MSGGNGKGEEERGYTREREGGERDGVEGLEGNANSESATTFRPILVLRCE